MTTPALRAEHAPDKLVAYRNGLETPLITQRAAPNARPFIHPLRAPDGDGELTENEPGHHVWQHGLYVGLNDVNGVGFWTEGHLGRAATDGTFHPQPLAPPVLDRNTARWRVITEWRGPDGAALLTETQAWRFEDRGDVLALDLDWTLNAAVDLRFGAYAYGGLFLRMPWRPETRGAVLTSEGDDSREAAEGKRARWVALAMPLPGRVGGGTAGVALMDHPANAEYPAPWRVDDNLGIAPSRCIAGEWRLKQNEATTSRYRVWAYTGGINAGGVEAEWKRFAQTAKEQGE